MDRPRLDITFTPSKGQPMIGRVLEQQGHLARVYWQDWTRANGQKVESHESWVDWTADRMKVSPRKNGLYELAEEGLDELPQQGEVAIWQGPISAAILRSDGETAEIILQRNGSEIPGRFAVWAGNRWKVVMGREQYEEWCKRSR